MAQVVDVAASMKTVLAVVKSPQNEAVGGGGGGGGGGASHSCQVCGKSYFTAQDLATHVGLRHDNTLVLDDDGVPVPKASAADGYWFDWDWPDFIGFRVVCVPISHG